MVRGDRERCGRELRRSCARESRSAFAYGLVCTVTVGQSPLGFPTAAKEDIIPSRFAEVTVHPQPIFLTRLSPDVTLGPLARPRRSLRPVLSCVLAGSAATTVLPTLIKLTAQDSLSPIRILCCVQAKLRTEGYRPRSLGDSRGVRHIATTPSSSAQHFPYW